MDKNFSSKCNRGWNHHEVKVGQDIKYSIKLPNVKTSAQTIVVTDVLSKGLTYNSDMSVTNGSVVTTVTPRTNSDTKETTLVWTISVPAGKTAVLNYSAKVNDDAVNLVNNNASCQYGTDPSIKLAELHNPVPTKKRYYRTMPSDVATARKTECRMHRARFYCFLHPPKYLRERFRRTTAVMMRICVCYLPNVRVCSYRQPPLSFENRPYLTHNPFRRKNFVTTECPHDAPK